MSASGNAPVSAARQGWIGMTLATLIIGAWLCLHVFGVFFADIGRREWSFVLSVALVAALTWLSAGLYIVAHDAMHGSLWPAKRRAGDAVGALALRLYAGFSFRAQLPMHHAHHRHPGTADDPDFAPHSPTRAVAWYAQFLSTYFGWRELAIMTARVGLYLLLGARVENILLFFALPGILASFQLFYFGTYLPHRHERSGQPGFADHHHARSNEYGTLLSLLTCFHFGYHHEHHRHPGTPWWRLPSLR